MDLLWLDWARWQAGHADYGSGFAVMRDTNNRYRGGAVIWHRFGCVLWMPMSRQIGLAKSIV